MVSATAIENATKRRHEKEKAETSRKKGQNACPTAPSRLYVLGIILSPNPQPRNDWQQLQLHRRWIAQPSCHAKKSKEKNTVKYAECMFVFLFLLASKARPGRAEPPALLWRAHNVVWDQKMHCKEKFCAA